MGNIWKRSLSMLLALVMVFGMLPVSAFASEAAEQEPMTEETSVTEPVTIETTEAAGEPAETVAETVLVTEPEETEATLEQEQTEAASEPEWTEEPAATEETVAAEETQETMIPETEELPLAVMEETIPVEMEETPSEKDAQGLLEDAMANCDGDDYVLSEALTLARDMTINLQGGTFYISDDGVLTVPSGLTLTVVGQLEVLGGKIVVLEGGMLKCVDGHIQIRSGFVFFETGAFYDVHMDGTAYWEANGDTAPHLLVYNLMDEGSGVSPNWESHRTGGITLVPGQYFTGLFCFREWDPYNYEWNEIFMDPQHLSCGTGLTMTRLKDMPDPGHIIDADPYGNKYVTITAENAFDVDTYVSYSYYGEEYRVDIDIKRPGEHGFYTDDFASNDTFLNHFNDCFTVDPKAGENSFYYIFTAGGDWKVENFEVVNNPFENIPVEEVTWEKISDTVYKITVKPEVAADMPEEGFPVHVNVYVSHPNNNNLSRWGIGQLWCRKAAMRQEDLQEKLDQCVADGTGYVQTEKLVLTQDLTIDLGSQTFSIAEGGMIVVPEGVTLTVASFLEVNGGKLVVLAGGRLETVQGAKILIQGGIVYFKTGAKCEIKMDGVGAYWEADGDTATKLAAYGIMDEGSGAVPNWSSETTGNTILPGMAFSGLFCICEWDDVNYEWKRTCIDPRDLTYGQGLQVMALADTPNPGHILTGDRYGRMYTAVIADYAFDVQTYVSYDYNGQTYRYDIRIERPRDHFFYTEPVASNETYLGFEYLVNPKAKENAFYYIFTNQDGWKIESFKIVNNHIENLPVEEVTWKKISDTVYKIIIKPDVVAKMDYTSSFPVQVQVRVYNPENGKRGNWGVGQVWCQLPRMNQDTLEGNLEESLQSGTGWVLNTTTVLDRDLTIDLNDELFFIDTEGLLVIPEGVTLIVDGDVTLGGGRIWIRGGKLVINGNVLIHKGSIDMEQGGIIANNGLLTNRDTITVGDGSIIGPGTLITVPQGIDNADLVACPVIYGAEATTESALIDAVTGGLAEIYVSRDIILDEALTIPEDVTLIVEDGVTLKVNTKTTFANNGKIVVNGTLDISSTSDVENHGQMNIYGTVKISTDKSLVTYGFTNVYAGGYLEVSKGEIYGTRIAQIPDEKGVVGTILLPEHYQGFYYTEGVAVESFQLVADKLSVPVGGEAKLFIINVQPANAEFHGFTIETDHCDEPIPHGILTCDFPGVVIATAYLLDAQGNKMDITRTLEIVFEEQQIQVKDQNGNAEFNTNLLSGEKISLTAEIIPNATNTELVWELAGNGADYATLSVKKGVATVTALAVTEYQKVNLVVSAADGTAKQKVIKLQIRPRVQELNLLNEAFETVTNKTITFDLNWQGPDDDYPQNTMILRSVAAPEDASRDMEWVIGNQEIIDSITEIGDGIYELHFTGAVGKTTITAASTDGSKKSAKLTIIAVKLLQNIYAEVDGLDLIGGQKVTCNVLDETGAKVKDTLVEWFLCDESGYEIESHPYISITAKGKLTTKPVAEAGPVYIRARVVGNESKTTEVIQVRIYPAVTKAAVKVNGSVVDGSVYYDLAESSPLKLSVDVYPHAGAIDRVQWSRPEKSAAYADINPKTGVITPTGESGAVTFTGVITMWNGSTKKVTVQVLFDTLVHDLVFYTGGYVFDNEKEPLIMWGGESYMPIHEIDTLDANGNSVDAGLSWTVDPAGQKYLTVKNGEFKLKNVENPFETKVAVTSEDGNCTETLRVIILPKRDKQDREILLLKNVETGAYVTKSTLRGTVGTQFELVAADFFAGAVNVTDWISDNKSVATVDDTGLVTVAGNGTATITAVAEDGRSATVKVMGTRVSTGVTIEGPNTVASGKKLTLTGTVSYTSGKEDAAINWSVSDSTLAKITAKGVLTAAANLTKPTVVTVYAAAKDGCSEPAQFLVSILPLATGVKISEEDVNYTDAAITRCVGETMDLDAVVFPMEAYQVVTWKSSKDAVAEVDPVSGELTCLKAGSAVITAAAADGSGKKATIKLTVVKPMESETLQPLSEQIWGISGGKSLKLASAIKIPSDVTNKKLNWQIVGGEGAAYAKISSSGVLTTKAVTEAKELTLQATAADGYGAASDVFTVTIYPITKSVQIVDDDGVVVNNKTLYLFVGDSLNLNASGKPVGAWDSFTWTSSGTKYATVSDGVVEGLAAGAGKTVTITAAADDGSGKKATVKVKVLQAVESITFAENLTVAGGKSLKLMEKVTFNEGITKPTNQTLTWKILEGGAYATISTKGELKAKKVHLTKTVHIQATATDGSGVTQDCYVTIYPAR